ncbi:MAG: sugar MFS transporter, partial [Halobacteriales archaeon]
MTGSNRRSWLIALCGFVAIEGVGFQMRGALIPELRAEFGVSEALLGLVAPAGTVGFVLVILLVGVFAGRIDFRRTMLAGAGIVAACMFLLGLSPTYLVFLGALFLRGTSTALVRGPDRVVLGHLFPDLRGRVFNIYAMAWAIGATLGPVFVVVALALGNWRFAYLALAAGLVPVVVAVYRLDLDVAGEERALTMDGLGTVLREPRVVGPAVALIFSGGLEGGLFTWLPTYAGESLPQATASLTLSTLIVGYIPGRLLYGAYAERVGYLRLVTLSATGAVPLVYLLTVVEGVWLFPVVGTLGLVISGVFPTLAAAAIDAVPDYSGPVNALTIATSYAGLSVVPAVMGVVAARAGIGVAMGLLVGVAAGAVV